MAASTVTASRSPWGRGTEIVVAAVRAMRSLVCNYSLEEFTADMGAFWRHVTGDEFGAPRGMR